MMPGDSIEFQIGEIALATVRYYACTLGRELCREYHTRTVKSRGVYIITREA